MATLYKANGGKVEVEPKNGRDFSLKELRGFVHGDIELLGLRDGKWMCVNETGKLDNLEPNIEATRIFGHDIIAGDALVCERDQIR